MDDKIGVLFVCMANICRSPLAEGVFKHMVVEKKLEDSIFVDSAGTRPSNIGAKPDIRSINTAKKMGIDISELKSRILEPHDLEVFQYILVMDRANMDDLKFFAAHNAHLKNIANVHYLMEFADTNSVTLSNPYLGNESTFDELFTKVVKANQGLLKYITQNLTS